MALNVQNSTGSVANANAYVTLAEFKAYHDERGNDYSAFADPAISAAIVRATDYLDTRFQFRGSKQSNGVKATGTLTTTGNFSSGETVAINGTVYTFRLAPSVPDDVLIAGTTAASLANLVTAINAKATDVVAASDATTLTATAISGGAAPNLFATTETCANASWGGAVLSGGSAQTTEFPRMSGPDILTATFDISIFMNPVFVDSATGNIVLLTGPDGLPIEGIPPAVKRACNEYSFRALSILLFQDAPAPDGGRPIAAHDVTVDVISESIKYEQGQIGSFVMPAFPAADLLLARAGLIDSGRVLTR